MHLLKSSALAPFLCYVGITLSESSIDGYKEVTFAYKLCTYIFDTGTLHPASQSLSDLNNRDQQKSFAFYTGMFLETPTCKNKVLCVAWLKCICVNLNTNPSSCIYAIYKKVSSENRRVTQAPHGYFSTSTYSKT